MSQYPPELHHQPWKPLALAEKSYLLKYNFDRRHTTYNLLLYKDTDSSMWQDNLTDSSSFQTKWNQYNPNIESNVSASFVYVEEAFEECLRGVMTEKGGNSVSMQILEMENQVEIVFKCKIKLGIPISWTFTCVRCKQTELKDLLVDPVFVMMRELRRQRREL